MQAEIALGIHDLLFLLISYSVIAFAFILAMVLILKKQGRRTAQLLLGVLLIIACLIFLNNLIILLGLPQQYNQLYFLPLDYTLSIGPLLFFYFKFKLKPSAHFRKKDLLHFLVPLIQAAIYLPVGLASVAMKEQLWKSGLMSRVFLVDNLLFPFSIGFYAYLAFRLLKEAKKNEHYWNAGLEQWLRNFLHIALLLISIQICFIIMEEVILLRTTTTGTIHFLLLLSLLLWLSLKAWQQYFPEQIYQLRAGDAKNTKSAVSRHDQTIATDEDMTGSAEDAAFIALTTELFEQRQIYLNPDLNLAMLSRKYGLSRRKVSENIKKIYGKNVSEFMNNYRMEYVLQALQDKQHRDYTLLAIAFSAGFPSKSTFYRVFQQTTGLTPTAYIQSLEETA